MAWTTPGTATAGEVLTAAFWNANVRDNSLMGHPVFTDETARDAALTAPIEGMIAYLTAPTTAILNATGNATAIPTGIQTIYNGSAWVCTTEIGAQSNNSATRATNSYADTLTGDATAISVKLNTGTTALITICSTNNNSTAAQAHVSFAISGATTLAASDINSIINGTSGTNMSVAYPFIVTGLTAGVNTFTLNYKATAGTATFIRRSLTVKGIA
jgi:archaellum component FlaF (FlaF/FlaG flagellin family)